MTTATVKLPDAVRRQGREADRMADEIRKKQAEARGESEPAPPPPATPPPADPPAPDPQPPAPPAPPQPTADELKAQLDKAERRYATLQSKYNAEVPRLHQANQDLARRLEELENKLKEPPKPVVPAEQRHLTPEDRELGEPVLGPAARVARGVAEDAILPLAQEVKRLQEQVRAQADQAFFSVLTSLVPDWRAFNKDEGFLDWLDQVDDLSTETRQVKLEVAFNRKDADLVARFFRAYKAQAGLEQPRPSAGLNGKVQPPLSPAATPPPKPAPKGKTWTEQDIKTFYERVARGLYRNRPDEQRRIEADIEAATRENRIAR